ncbi:unnamed protein product [Rangifer tarandus platyrhynchus]|uniref:Uncharacterized protein n=2 Tax=Rangifer tarandus platyrhynchus TaxID=3082113 RepID=A0ABN8Z8M3_RANTA|nr:unnamed protein product [Rangifer tarandus platyrhynchus]CAI9703909.1 unnamed protein product [Rangifer tarandus platyrhynchus]
MAEVKVKVQPPDADPVEIESRGKPTPKCSQERSHLRAQICVVKNGATELQGAVGTEQVTSPCLGSECGLVPDRSCQEFSIHMARYAYHIALKKGQMRPTGPHK